jgi:hypothetical protein
MSLDTFIVFDPCTNRWFAACEAYLVDTRKLSDEEYDALFDRPSPKTQEILNKHGMTLDSCEYHKIMECAEEVEETEITDMCGGNTPIVPEETINEWIKVGLLTETKKVTAPEIVEIDLEEFVNKEVVITTNSDVIREGRMTKAINSIFPYELHNGDGKYYICYNREGYNITHNASKSSNIKHIELKKPQQPQQPQKPMTPLSDATIAKLGDALTDDAIKYLETDEEVIETLVSVIGRFLTDRMGQMDDTLLNELSFIIFDNFDIVSNNK